MDYYTKQGGPAFPHAEVSGRERHEMHGMTLRDYAALHAPVTFADAIAFCGIQDQFEAINSPHKLGSVMQVMSVLRWQYADAMIAARKALEAKP